MKDFLKFTFASVIGVILAGVVFTILGIITLVGIVASSDTETVVKDNSIFVLDFKGSLSERVQENPLQQLLGEEFEAYGLDDILASIKKAKDNDKIKGIYIQPSYLEASYASLEEIRNALLDFKESGKFIVAYADQYAQGMYYLSSVADKIIINPQGSIGWHGAGMQPVFFKNLVSKLGLEVQVFRVGTYKSAVEPFIATEMSPANREQMTECLESVWHRILADVSDSRRIPTDTLNAYADRYMDFCQAEEYIQCKLADTLMYKDEVISYLKQLSGRDEDDKLNSLFIEDMINVKKNVPKDKSGNIIAVYYAYGEILDAPGSSTEDCIDYAASGGYYISCAANRIFADPTTLTGSIGIFGMMYSGEKLFTETLGLNFDVVKTNKMADLGASLGPVLTRPLNASEQELMQNYVNRGYKLFVNRCAEGRKMSTEAIEKVAEGRVWTGAMAKDLGLVDELGGIDKALNAAATQAGIENYSIIGYPEKENIFASLLGNQKKHYINSEIKEYLGSYYNSFKALENIKDANCIQARMPFDPNIQ